MIHLTQEELSDDAFERGVDGKLKIKGAGNSGGSGNSYYGSWTLSGQNLNIQNPFLGATVTSSVASSGVGYDNVTGVFSVANSGIYTVNVSIFAKSAGASYITFALFKNGVIISNYHCYIHASVAPASAAFSIILDLAANDELAVTSGNVGTDYYIGTSFTIKN